MPTPDNRGAFESFLDWLDAPGNATRNLLRGNVGAAGRSAADFLLDPLDAAIPFWDAIPQMREEGDRVSGADLVGLTEDDPWYRRIPVDIGVGMATDPLTFVGGPLFKAAGSALKAAPKVPGKAWLKATGNVGMANKIDTTIGQTGAKIRSVFGAGSPSDDVAAAIAEAQSRGNVVGKTAGEYGVQRFGPLDEAARSDATLLANDILDTGVGPAQFSTLGVQPAEAFGTMADQMALIDQRLAKTGWTKDRQDAARKILEEEFHPYYRNLWQQQVKDKVVSQPHVFDTPAGMRSYDKASADMAAELQQAQDAVDKAQKRLASAENNFTYANGAISQAAVNGGNIVAAQNALQAADAARQAARATLAGAEANLKGIPTVLDQYAASKGWNSIELPADYTPLDYLPRNLERLDGGVGILDDAKGGKRTASMLQKRDLTPDELVDQLNAGKFQWDIRPDMLAGTYGTQAGRAAQSSSIGRWLLAKSADPNISRFKDQALTSPGFADAVRKEISALDDAGKWDDALALKVAFEGLPPRGAFDGALAKLNSFFKPAATGGAFIPKPAFSVRNYASSPFMVASDKVWEDNLGGLVKTLGTLFVKAPEVLAGGGKDWLKELGAGLSESRLDLVSKAIAQSGGKADDALQILSNSDPKLAAAWKHGVIDSGFVSAENMMDKAGSAGKLGKFKHVMYAPGAMAKGVEDRMRLLTWELLQKNAGLSEAEAAQVTKRMLYDYSLSSTSNRLYRDIIPFGQFLAKAVPQQLAGMTRSGVAGAAMRQIPIGLFGADEGDPVYPYMQGNVNIPLGSQDEKGRNLYLSQFGLPFESLSQIPNISDNFLDFAQQTRRGVVSSAHPMLKQAGAAAFGLDPYFGTPFASYDKPPALFEALGMEQGGAARTYNALAGSGMIQPVASIVNTFGIPFGDESIGQDLANTFTGVRVRAVDPDRAVQQGIEDYLGRNPEVKRRTSFYLTEEDDATQQLLNDMKAAAKRAKERAKAFAEAAP